MDIPSFEEVRVHKLLRKLAATVNAAMSVTWRVISYDRRMRTSLLTSSTGDFNCGFIVFSSVGFRKCRFLA